MVRCMGCSKATLTNLEGSASPIDALRMVDSRESHWWGCCARESPGISLVFFCFSGKRSTVNERTPLCYNVVSFAFFFCCIFEIFAGKMTNEIVSG